ncbi:MAG: hypothetical protein P4M08_10515 [Oligoflexia bacterium]|nr:hypothetical protein [Oligoflexia bacterium]
MDPATQADNAVQAAQPVAQAAADAAVQAVQTVAHSVPVQPFVLDLIVFTKALIMPTMFFVFFAAIVLRALIYYTVKREDSFVKEFERRVNFHLDGDDHLAPRSFFVLTKKLIEKTYYEMFEMRAIMKRRKLDHVMVPSDRIFLVQEGTARLVRDTLKEVQFVKYDGIRPPLLEIIKNVFSNNPCFTRVFGILPVGAFNDLLNIIPGLFIVAGIFGTFLGIMQALPELGAMDIRDPESTKLVMDTFLAKIAFSMSTSTVGIMLSVVTTVFNNFLSPERLFVKIVDRFERNLFRLWSRCDNNQLPSQIPAFDEHRDPIEALASLAIEKAIPVPPAGKGNPSYGAPAAPAAPAAIEEAKKKDVA